ncbi:MAG: hypothetical protein HYU97_09255 [Deltaproteobacteria bacterium]|nr:hypothetical protein [Deltaproteobacteria bacterium]
MNEDVRISVKDHEREMLESEVMQKNVFMLSRCLVLGLQRHGRAVKKVFFFDRGKLFSLDRLFHRCATGSSSAPFSKTFYISANI